MADGHLLDWLLEGDPSIRWQVMRDLQGLPDAAVNEERARVSTTGWGSRLLAEQDVETAMWANGLYNPKWTSTHYSLQLLSKLGPFATEGIERGVDLLLAKGVRSDGGVDYTLRARTGETCISGMLLAIAARFGVVDERTEPIVDCLLREQMADGGWNCQRPRGATHSSFHTTINVLEGLAAYRSAGGGLATTTHERELPGREFLAAHRLFRSHTKGHVVKSSFKQFSFPHGWYYDVLRGLDYLQATGADRDERFAEGIELVRSRRRPDGTWPRQNRHSGKEWLEMEPIGKPSRWNTLRALRVLRWWEGP